MVRISRNCYLFLFGFTLVYSNPVEYRGRFAAIGELPHVVFLSIAASRGNASCTGALIDKSWVITAAHCVYDDKTVNPADVTIIAGINNTNVSPPSKQQTIGAEIELHPKYLQSKLSSYDLALIKVLKPFRMSRNVSTIGVEGTGWPLKDGTEGRHCIASGFGRISMGKAGYNTKLKYMEVSALHGEKSCPCTKRWQWKRMVCLKPEEGYGLCPGDSGGVLICDNKAVGVAHVIMDRRTCSFVQSPDSQIECLKTTTITFLMFTCPENNWMRKYVASVPPTPESCISCVNQVCVINIFTAIFILLVLN